MSTTTRSERSYLGRGQLAVFPRCSLDPYNSDMGGTVANFDKSPKRFCAGAAWNLQSLDATFSEALLKNLVGKLTPYFIDRCPFTPKPKANAPVNGSSPGSSARGRRMIDHSFLPACGRGGKIRLLR